MLKGCHAKYPKSTGLHFSYLEKLTNLTFLAYHFSFSTESSPHRAEQPPDPVDSQRQWSFQAAGLLTGSCGGGGEGEGWILPPRGAAADSRSYFQFQEDRHAQASRPAGWSERCPHAPCHRNHDPTCSLAQMTCK